MKKDLPSSITEKYSGFQMVKAMLRDRLRIDFQPIDIVFELVKHYKQKIDCYFYNQIIPSL